MKHLIILLALFLLLISCNRYEESYDTSNPILVMAYSKDYQYPTGFFNEFIDTGSIYYVNTVSIKPIEEREDIWIDLSCDDIVQARAWSELTDSFSSYHRTLESERETNRYFEFKRVSPINRRDMVLTRVHKTSYFKPLSDKFRSPFIFGNYLTTDTIGQIEVTNFQSNDIKNLIEYLWSSGAIGYQEKVEKTDFTDSANVYSYLINSISIIYGDWNLNDSVTVYSNYFNVSKLNGIITLDRQFKEGFYGKSH
jgi:hypothetical protein